MPAKTADQWFAEYGESHLNPTNKLIHWLCVPAIAASLLALLWELPVPAAMARIPYLNWATLLVLGALLFYMRLSLPLAVGMLLFTGPVLAGIATYQSSPPVPLWQVAATVFVTAWILQFVGHKIEGKKPKFLQDVQFLLIGPIWLLGFIYRRLGIRY